MVNQPQTSPGEPSKQHGWFKAMLIILTLLYWIFARYLERIDLTPGLTQWWQATIPIMSLPGFVVTIAEMLHPRVWRHLIAVYVGWSLARGAAIGLIQMLYDLPNSELAHNFLSRLQSSSPPAGGSQRVSAKTLERDREESVLIRVGGPGSVVISSEEVAVTEVNGRFHRVLGPGRQFLGSLEYIYALIDLRKQERTAKDILLMTKDGIEVKADVSISYRISTGGEVPTRARPYPFDESAVRLAAYAETVLPRYKVSKWDEIPLITTRDIFAEIIAKFQLDDLLQPQIPSSDPYLTITRQLERRTRTALEKSGIELTELHIGRLDLPDQVINQYIEFWQSHWETQAHLKHADGEASSFEKLEVARAEAEVTMIRAIVEGLQNAQLDENASASQTVVALRMIEALEKVAELSQQAHPLPSDLLPQLENWRQQLSDETD